MRNRAYILDNRWVTIGPPSGPQFTQPLEKELGQVTKENRRLLMSALPVTLVNARFTHFREVIAQILLKNRVVWIKLP